MKKISTVLLAFFAISILTQSAFAMPDVHPTALSGRQVDGQGRQVEIMIFIGDGCPHCANVEQYVSENDVMSKLPIKYYEVWYNPENQALYAQKAQEVGYTKTGVPLLIDGNNFEIGDGPIIAYIENLLSKQTEETVKALEQDAKPVQPEPQLEQSQPEITPPAKLSANDSAELNDIIKEKISMKELLKSPYVYAIGGFVLLDILIALYIMRKKHRP